MLLSGAMFALEKVVTTANMTLYSFYCLDLPSHRGDINLFVYLQSLLTPSVATGDSSRPDLLLNAHY